MEQPARLTADQGCDPVGHHQPRAPPQRGRSAGYQLPGGGHPASMTALSAVAGEQREGGVAGPGLAGHGDVGRHAAAERRVGEGDALGVEAACRTAGPVGHRRHAAVHAIDDHFDHGVPAGAGPDGHGHHHARPGYEAELVEPAVPPEGSPAVLSRGIRGEGRGTGEVHRPDSQVPRPPDGGVPFGLPYPDTAGSARHWLTADSTASSLMTAQLAAQAHRLARYRADVAGHPWLVPATSYCLDQIEQTTSPHAIELMFVLRFLDAAAERTPRARPLLERFSGYVTKDGPHPVTGGAEGEVLHLLDFTPYSDAPSRAVFPAEAVAADRDRLASQQQPDGGWEVSYHACSPAGALEWRGYTTVQSVTVLQNGRL